ncbi:response regulator [uncultured Phascolarctobacterium sp.]|jgi:signal transduction histidine kinase/DNA-binding LytR/AlgR family response regulator|uniref:response regulator n=1 Tax=uncultured Phascolarctobacterium sp. TaxID=512296 RepID=UPI0025DCBF44|nr:transporter substrate-binding domain-containing protein [uncultured Phascolarctobacterium sp.]
MMRKRRFLSGYVCFFLSVFLLLVCLPLQALATESKVVRVGWYDGGYNITGPSGERSGYGYDFQQTVAAYTGWRYEYVKGSSVELLEKLQRGEIDMLNCISYTPERAQHMLFSSVPMGREKYYLYADIGKTGLSPSKLYLLEGKGVSMIASSMMETAFSDWEKQQGLHTQHMLAGSMEERIRLVAQGAAEAVVATEFAPLRQEGLSAVMPVGGSDIYFAISKSRPDLKAELDEAMRRIEQDKPFYAESLYKHYMPTTAVPVLSKDEQAWLAQHGKIRIGCMKGDRGFFSYEEDGSHKGVIADYILYASSCFEEQRLDFAVQGFDTQGEMIQALKDGKIDMIFHFNENHYLAEENGFVLSNRIMSITIPVITAHNEFNENAANILAVAKNNYLAKAYAAHNYPQWKLVEYASRADAEQAVRSGQADCFFAKYSTLTDYADDKLLHAVFLTKPGDVAFAVNRGDTVLLSVLNKTLRAMPGNAMAGNMSMYDKPLQDIMLKDFIKQHMLLLVAVLVLIIGIMLRLLYKERKAARETASLNERLQESQKQLEQALQKAESASEAKTNFLSNMSHDIRTPMNALLGYTMMLKPKIKDEQLLGYVEKMERSGKLLLSIINHVLDMARIESGRMEVNEVYTRVGIDIEEVISVFSLEAKKKNIRLLTSVQVEHGHIMADLTKIREIFSNLLSNAIKYTPEGGTVQLNVRELPCSRPGYTCIQAEIADNGIGMSKEYLPTLFDAFTRERNTTVGKISGTGLGMPIVKNLVEMQGGTIEVESELGKGSRFIVTLEHPIADEAHYKPQEQEAKSAQGVELLKGKRILLAEDNDLNAEIALFILQNMGLEVERVEDGAQCVSRLEQQPAGTYDLIFMDVQMPQMDGYEATQAIRALDDKEKAAIPIVAMTANAFAEDRERALAAGMNGHIAKPIDVKKLEQVLVKLLG